MIHHHQALEPTHALGDGANSGGGRDMVDRLVATWLAPMRRLDWRRRLELLEEIDRLLGQQLEPGSAQRVSRAFTAQLLHRLEADAIESLDQAWVYLNSADDTHAQRARRWLGEARTP